MEMEKKAEEKSLNLTSKTKDIESPTSSNTKKRRRRNICLAATASIIILIVLIIVILAFTVFKAKQPTTEIDSISLHNLKLAINPARMSVDLNISLDVDLTVKNPNKVDFKYKDGSAFLKYRGEVVGVVPIPAGEMGADEARPMNVTVTVMADRLLSNSQLFSDAMSGLLKVTTLVKLAGKVVVLNIFRIKVQTTTTCDVTVLLSNATIADQNCKYKTKI